MVLNDEMLHKRTELSPAKRALLARRLRGEGTGAGAGPADPELPRIVADPERRYEPFPLTEIQQAYWIGRGAEFELGNVAMHLYFEIDADGLDLDRLTGAWRRLIGRHEVLRSIILPEGKAKILPEVPPYEIVCRDLRGETPAAAAACRDALRAELSHQVLPTDRWPLFDLRAFRLDDRRTRLYFSIEGLIADAGSLIIVLREWARLYADPEAVLPPLALSFRDYALAEARLGETEAYARALAFWREKIPGLPPGPDLPLARQPGTIARPRFARQTGVLERAPWEALKARAAEAGVTPSAALLAAFARVLGDWCRVPRFTLNVPIFNRLPLHPEVDAIVGDFTSLILVPVEDATGGSFSEQAQRAQRELVQGLQNRLVSGVRVLRELARSQGSGAATPLGVVFTSNLTLGADGGDTFPFGALGELVYGINQTPQVWLDHQVMERGGALVFHWDAVEDLFPDGMLRDMLAAFHRLLRDLASSGAAWSGPAASLVPRAHRDLQARANATGAPVEAIDLYGLFARAGRAHPERRAVAAAGRSLTYGELLRLSAGTGSVLRRLGAGTDRPVAVVMEKGWEQVVAVLGAVAAGAPYLPIDPQVPPERLRFLLEDGGVEIALVQERLDGLLAWPAGVRRLPVETDVPADGAAGPQPGASPHDLAYVIYTSGSTGRPKGVMIEQGSVVNRILDVNRRFAVGPDDRVFALTALHHDLSVYDLFGTLAAGGTLVLPDPGAWLDPAHWVERMVREGVTVWSSVPAFLQMLVDYLEGSAAGAAERMPGLRLALLAGDWIPVALPDRLRARVEGVEVIAMGGPTETTVWDICDPVGRVDPAWPSIPYGRPMANARYHVLDDRLRPRPVWVPGELCIGGAGLARGYWRDEELTRERFVRHPETGERLYRSGDLGRWLPEGNLEFLGRRDLQVKIQGQRIELGEIEAALARHPAVRAAVAAAVGEPRGSRRLVAWVVGTDGPPPDESELRRFLADSLPAALVPSAFVALDALPMTRNGKVDRRALPEPLPAPAPEAGTAGGGALVERLQRIVAGVLGVERVAPETELFSLGATSIEIVKIANLLERELGTRPKINELVQLSSVAAIAGYYARLEPAGGAAPAAARPREGKEILLDPEAREEFKRRQLGIRRFAGAPPPLPLPAPELDVRLYRERTSSRTFGPEALPLARLGHLLASLRQISIEGKPKYRWASAGGLYPVQVYLHAKPGRIEELAGGTYYYHPVEHRLVPVDPGAVIERDVHFWNNQPVFDGCAFSLFLVGDLRAVEPLYGELSLGFCLIEAGIVAHHLEIEAASQGIGLCQVANVNFEAIRDRFRLEESHVYLHGLLGGALDRSARPSAAEAAPGSEAWEQGEL
jgi:amino acid adenylation domain-containing protein